MVSSLIKTLMKLCTDMRRLIRPQNLQLHLLVFKDAFERAQSSTDKEKVRDALAKTDMQTFYGTCKIWFRWSKRTAKPMVLIPSIDVTMMILCAE